MTSASTSHVPAAHPATSRRDETRAVLLRDKYHGTEQVTHRLSGRVGRCPVVGSEMVVVDGRAMCPSHARQWHAQQAAPTTPEGEEQR